ncbi:zinc finger protein-like 1 isoform X3 [Caloenas nicobarica]|uniref:zinc finger protein-like 1 isoform X3 n=1 Tax=Caloenas nicobarica TaxID=187106 RepID=UPI0032B8766D
MGLCKCPKRRVTNLFCFEHRVNVCESCLVSGHTKCVVRSYLQWLQDSDYSPDCPLCRSPLSDRDTVRLVCYDVFHWGCLSSRARALPPRTAPAGHRCPTCGGPVFPPPNLEGPVAAALRRRLRCAPWARPGLGLPAIPDPGPDPELEAPDGGWNAPPEPPPPRPSPPPHAVVHMGGGAPAPQGSGPRKPLGGRGNRDPPGPDDDKYGKRNPRGAPPRNRCGPRGAPRPPLLALALGGAFAALVLLLGALRSWGGAEGGGAEPALLPLPHLPVGH